MPIHCSSDDRLHAIFGRERRRTRLMTVMVCLGMICIPTAVPPFAVLLAASQGGEPDVKTNAVNDRGVDEQVARNPTPEEIEARKTSIRISVLNATGDRAIPLFRIIAGIPAGSVSNEFEKRTGRTVTNWQPHTLRVGTNGDLLWPLANAYDEMAIRVEADGYVPQVLHGIKKADGAKHAVFMLAEDKGITGHVKTFAGKAAAGATVALSLPHQSIAWDGSTLYGATDPIPEKPSDRWRRPRFVKADDEGVFQLPTEIEPAAILVVHVSGVLELSYDDWQKSPDVTLQRWGRVAGQVLWQDKPGADEEIDLSVHRDEFGYPGMVSQSGKTRSDKAGKFLFERVLPGQVQLSRPIKPANSTNITSVVLDGMYQHVNVVAGDVTSTLIGGRGRTVTGRFAGLENWDGATFHFHPNAPHIGFKGDDVMWAAFGQLKESAVGPIFFRDKQPINKDGTFTIERMLPGHYQLFVSAPGFKNYAIITRVQIEPELPDQEPKPVDLGVIAAKN